MGELGLNKIFGALLAVALAVLGLRELSTIVFSDGGGHYGTEYESLNGWAKKNFAYTVDIPEVGGGSADVIEEVYDLGLLLASADVTRGERSFKGKCATCHTIAEGGANGTGPNLYNSIAVPKQHVAGFAYSGALEAVGGEWTYEAMDAWLEAPSRYARGTSMAFAGLKRDDERANVIAYLASYTPNAPAFPDPLPQAVEEAIEDVSDSEVTEDDTAVIDAGETDAAIIVVEDAPADAADAIEEAAEEIAPDTPTEN